MNDGPRGRWLLVVVFLTGFVVRLGLAAPWAGRPLDDPDSYWPLAQRLAAGKGYCRADGRPTAYRPPLFPIVLTPWTFLPESAQPWATAFLNAALGTATALLTNRTARLWGANSTQSLAAVAIVSFDPVLVVRSGSVMTEPLATFLLTGAFFSVANRSGTWRRRDAALSGFWFGLAALCRPSTLAVAVAVATCAALHRGASNWSRLGLMVLALIGTMTPWAIRNALVLGEPVWTTTHGGYTLALANNPAYYQDVLRSPADAVWTGPNQRAWFEKISQETVEMSEPEADRYLRNQALEMLQERPRDFVRSSLGRLGRFWAVAPSPLVYGSMVRALTALWTVPFWLAAAWSLLNRRTWKWPRLTALAGVLALSAVHTVYWTDMRMRAPIVPALALLAVVARSPRPNGSGGARFS